MSQSPTLVQWRPPAQLGYDTLTPPNTFTAYCFYPDCPEEVFPSWKYDPEYTAQQKDEYQLGLTRYLESRQVRRDFNRNGVPVFNTNQKWLADDQMIYDPETQTPRQSPWGTGIIERPGQFQTIIPQPYNR